MSGCNCLLIVSSEPRLFLPQGYLHLSLFGTVVEPGKPAWKLIIGHFGVGVLLDDGRIDRPKLGRIIFEDAGKRHLLNSCTHLYIQRAMLWEAVKCFLRGWSSSGGRQINGFFLSIYFMQDV